MCVCAQAFQGSPSEYDRVEQLLNWMDAHFATLTRR